LWPSATLTNSQIAHGGGQQNAAAGDKLRGAIAQRAAAKQADDGGGGERRKDGQAFEHQCLSGMAQPIRIPSFPLKAGIQIRAASAAT